MNTKLFKTLCIVLLLPLFSFTNGPIAGKFEKSTTIHKKFNVDANDLLRIDNRYGNVDIATWDKNTIDIEVVITVRGKSEDQVEKKLGNIDVEFNQNSNEVSAKTIIGKTSNWSWWGHSNNVNYKINYTVKMPISNALNLTNDYGAISLDKLKGSANISCDYGSFDIGELQNSTNKINADYVSSSSIGFVNGVSINSDYSKLNIDKANDIRLNADYNTTQIGEVKNIKYSCDYGSLSVQKADVIEGSGDYISIRVGTLSKSLNITADYGSLKVEQILKNFETIKVTTDYTSGMHFGFASDSNFDFAVNLEYAGFKYDGSHFNFNKKIVKTTSKYYEGHFGNAKGGGQVNIKAEYGSVAFFEN